MARSRGNSSLEAAVGLFFDLGGDPHPPDEGVYVEAEALVDAATERRLLARLTSGRRPTAVPGADRVPSCAEDFQRAKGRAKESEKWLCVNLQNPKVGLCETLNRSVWSRADGEEADLAERREALARQTLLWQRDFDHPEAAHFRSFYCAAGPLQESSCPVVCLLDPRTGRLLRRWDRNGDPFPVEDPSQALGLLEDFCRRHTLEGHSPPDSPHRSPASSPAIMCAPPPRQLDEDEGSCDFELVGSELAPAAPTKEQRDSLRRSLPAQPTDTSDPERVSLVIRAPSGKRLARTFRKSDGVRKLFDFVDAEWEEWEPYSLAVSNPPQKRLLKRPEEDAPDEGTLEECGVKHQSLLYVEPLAR